MRFVSQDESFEVGSLINSSVQYHILPRAKQSFSHSQDKHSNLYSKVKSLAVVDKTRSIMEPAFVIVHQSNITPCPGHINCDWYTLPSLVHQSNITHFKAISTVIDNGPCL